MAITVVWNRSARANSLVRVTGWVREAGSREPLEGTTVRLEGADLETATNEAGEFVLEGLAPGVVVLMVSAPGFLGRTVELELSVSEVRDITVFLFPLAGRAPAMTVETRRTDDGVIRHAITQEEAKRMPGSFGDPVRAVQNLPGVARSPYSMGLPIIRGAAPNESGYFLEGMGVPSLYHFVGLTSAVSADLIKEIDYLPGGYSARYGRLLGGIVDIEVNDVFPDRLHGYADVNVLDSSFILQGSLGDRFSYAVAGQRSYVDLLLKPFLTRVEGYQIRSPIYWDGQIRLELRVGSSTRLGLLLMGSSDDFALLGAVDSDQTGTSSDQDSNLDLTTSFSRALFQAHTTFGPRLVHDLVLSLGLESSYFSYGPAIVNEEPLLFGLRDEWLFKPKRSLVLRAGFDFLTTHYRFEAEVRTSKPI